MYILLLRTSRRVQGSHILHNNNVKYVRTFTVYIRDADKGRAILVYLYATTITGF